MEIHRFYTSANRLALAIETSGLISAVKALRLHLNGAEGNGQANISVAEAMVLRAGNDYADQLKHFTDDDSQLLETFHLQDLSTPVYWDRLTSSERSPASRRAELVSLYSRLIFASSHLPRLLSLIREAATTPANDTGADARLFALSLADLSIVDVHGHQQVESAADPDRIARVIDGANMLYQGAAQLAGGSPASLRLGSVASGSFARVSDARAPGASGSADEGSIGGYEHCTLVFHGQRETATAVRRIIRHLGDISNGALATESIESDDSAAENRVDHLPFLLSLNELERIGALTRDVADDIRANVRAGVIMLLEAGVTLAEPQPQHRGDPVHSDPAHTDLSIEAEVEAHYLDKFEAVRERLMGEEHAPQTDSSEMAKSEPLPEMPARTKFGDDQTDDLDDLIVDLNRLYKR